MVPREKKKTEKRAKKVKNHLKITIFNALTNLCSEFFYYHSHDYNNSLLCSFREIEKLYFLLVLRSLCAINIFISTLLVREIQKLFKFIVANNIQALFIAT